MSSKFSMVKSFVVTAALVAGASGMARADDGSTDPLTSDSYAYFRLGEPIVDSATSSSRESATNGLSEREMQALPSESPVFQVPSPDASAPASTNAPSWRQSHPHGLSFREYQALSSESPVWQLPNQSAGDAFGSTSEPGVARNAPNEPSGGTSSK
jgi:hypothetical protein